MAAEAISTSNWPSWNDCDEAAQGARTGSKSLSTSIPPAIWARPMKISFAAPPAGPMNTRLPLASAQVSMPLSAQTMA